MWEYAVLSEKVSDAEKKHVIIHADSSGLIKGFLRVECEGTVSKDAEGIGIISKVEGNIAIMCYSEAKWDAEEPIFSSPFTNIPKIDEIENAIAIWSNQGKVAEHDKMDELWTKHLGTRMTKVEWILEGEFTQPIYEGEKVTQVLSLAGAEGWELVGNIPGGDQRMLRRMKK